MKARLSIPMIKLPFDLEQSLYLIREELKSRKLFNILHKAGFDDCYFQPHLDSIILHFIGLEGGSDEIFEAYNTIMERRSQKIKADQISITKQALKAHHELMVEKKKRT